MIVAVASGKGGTGKTTVAVNLARALGPGVQLLDCDVEEPNARLFVPHELVSVEEVTRPVPEIDEALCDGCGLCAESCQFHALAVTAGQPMVFAELCHGCGLCQTVCPRNAIRERPHRIGVVETFAAGSMTIVQGRLDIGVAMAPPLIRAVQAHLKPGGPVILDAPPGTSCPVVATIRRADYVILVTEPTAFGRHDLGLAVDVVRQLDLPFGVVVNRAGIGDDRVNRFCAEAGVPILAELPDDRRVAEAYSRGELASEAVPEFRRRFEALADEVASAAPVRR